ncbi:MAG: HAMP domain-containing protein, partial [Thermodesulfobacteriota bacterium]|nr:HAMP domain-containing protein [Thermodesulfobacteriota bacterium]
MRRKRTLFIKSLFFVLPLVVLAVVITGATLTWISYKHFVTTVNRDYRSIIKSSAGEIRLFVKEAQKELEGLAWVIGATKLDLWQKEMALAAFHHTAEEFMVLSLVSPEGKKVLSEGWEGDDVAYGQKEVFQQALRGETALSKVVVGQRDIPYVFLAAPVRRLGAVKEVLWGQLNLKSVWDVLEGVRVGATGKVSILDLSGRFIGDVEMARVVRQSVLKRPDILASLRDSHAPLAWEEEGDQITYCCLGYRIPDLDWIIMLRQNRPEIYAHWYRNILWGLLITAGICLLAMFVVWNRAKHLLDPIQTLHGQVQRIGRGDLESKVSVHTGDEVEELASAFNDMTASLRQFIAREVESAKALTHAKNLALLGSTSSKVTHEVGNLLNNVGLTLSILKGEALSPGGE